LPNFSAEFSRAIVSVNARWWALRRRKLPVSPATLRSSVALPDWIERALDTAPEHSDRLALANLITHLFGPISRRTVEERPYTWILSNGKAVVRTRDAIAAEYERFVASPRYRGGRAKRAAKGEIPASPAARARRLAT
jgi:hypothetical protein